MTQELNPEQLLYQHLQSIAPVPPELWSAILNNVEFKTLCKNRHLTSQLFDMHIILEGMVIKRGDKPTREGNEVLDFISAGQYIFHMERIDHCYFETDCKSIAVLIDRELQDVLQGRHPIFNRHLRHFYVEVLQCRTFRSSIINLQGLEKKMLFKKHYPQAYRDCTVKDKSSFLGMTPYHYSSLDV